MSRLAPRLVFLALLAGGLLYWAHLRQPRDLPVTIDLTGSLPGEITEVDVIVRRSGHVLARHDERFGPAGAPGTLHLTVHAARGDAELETTLVYAGKPAHKSTASVTLSPKEPAVVRAE